MTSIRHWSTPDYTRVAIDVEQEINGILTYDRRPKFDLKEIKKINDLLV